MAEGDKIRGADASKLVAAAEGALARAQGTPDAVAATRTTVGKAARKLEDARGALRELEGEVEEALALRKQLTEQQRKVLDRIAQLRDAPVPTIAGVKNPAATVRSLQKRGLVQTRGTGVALTDQGKRYDVEGARGDLIKHDRYMASLAGEVEREQQRAQEDEKRAARTELAQAKRQRKAIAAASKAPPPPKPPKAPKAAAKPAAQSPKTELASLETQRAALAKQRGRVARNATAADKRLAAAEGSSDANQGRIRETLARNDRLYEELNRKVEQLDRRIQDIKDPLPTTAPTDVVGRIARSGQTEAQLAARERRLAREARVAAAKAATTAKVTPDLEQFPAGVTNPVTAAQARRAMLRERDRLRQEFKSQSTELKELTTAYNRASGSVKTAQTKARRMGERDPTAATRDPESYAKKAASAEAAIERATVRATEAEDRLRIAREKVRATADRVADVDQQARALQRKVPPPVPAPAPPPTPVRVRPARPQGGEEGHVVGRGAEYDKIIAANAELLMRHASPDQQADFARATAPTPPERQEKATRELQTAVEAQTDVTRRQLESAEKIGVPPAPGIVPRTLTNAGVFTREELSALEKLHGVPSPGPLFGQYPYTQRQGQTFRSRVEGEPSLPPGARSPVQDAGARLKAAQDAASVSGRELRRYNRDTTKFTQQQGEDLVRVHKENIARVDALRRDRKAIERDVEEQIAATRVRGAAENARIEAMRETARRAVNRRALATIDTTGTDLVAPPRRPIPNERAVGPYLGERIGGSRQYFNEQPRRPPPRGTNRVPNLDEVMRAQRDAARAARDGSGGSGGAGGGGGGGGGVGGSANEWDPEKAANAARAEEKLAASLRDSEDAMRRWNAQVGISDQAMRKHGTFTTEFIDAARRGDVAYREWGWQISAAAAKFGAWTAAGAGIYAAIGAVSKVGQGALDSASGIPSVRRTLPNLNAGEAQEQFRSLSTEFAVPIDQSADAMMRMGAVYRDQTEAFKAARVALLAFRTGEVDAATATQQLTAIATGMGVSADGLADIFDRLNYVQNNYGVRIPDLLTGTSKLSASWRQAGGDADHLVAIITALNRTAGVSGAQSATIISRAIGNVQRPSSAATLKAYGIDPDPTNIQGVFEQSIAVAQQPGTKPEDIQAIARALAGGTQYMRQFTALLQDPSIYKKLLGEEQAGKYKGSGQKELDQVMKTFTMRLAEIGAQLGNLGSNLAQSGFLNVLGSGVVLLTTALKTVNGLLEIFNELPGPIKSSVAGVVTLVAMLRVARRLGIGGAFQGRLGGVGNRIAPFLQEPAGRTARRNITKGLNDAVKEYQNDFERSTRQVRASNITRNNAGRRAEREIGVIRERMAMPEASADSKRDKGYLNPDQGSDRIVAAQSRAARATERYIEAEIAQENAAERLTSAREDLAAYERDQARGPKGERNQRALRFGRSIGAYGPASLPREQPSAEQVRRYGGVTPAGLPLFRIQGGRLSVDDAGTGARVPGADTSDRARTRQVRPGTTFRVTGDAAELLGRRARQAADETEAAARAAKDAADSFRTVKRRIYYEQGRVGYTAADRAARGTRPLSKITSVSTNAREDLLTAARVEAVGADRARMLGAQGFVGRQRQRFRNFQSNFNDRRANGPLAQIFTVNDPYEGGPPGRISPVIGRPRLRDQLRTSLTTASLTARLAPRAAGDAGRRAMQAGVRAANYDVGAAAQRASQQLGTRMKTAGGALRNMGRQFASIISPAELLVAGILALPAVFSALKGAIDKYNQESDDSLKDPKTDAETKDYKDNLVKRANEGPTGTEKWFKAVDDFKADPLKSLGDVLGLRNDKNGYAKQRQDAARAQLDAQRKLELAQKRARDEGRAVPELTEDQIDHDLGIAVDRYQSGRATIDDAIAATEKALDEIEHTSKLTDDQKADKREGLLNNLAQLNKSKQDAVQEEIDAQNAALQTLVSGGAATAGQIQGYITKQVGLINQFRGDSTAEGMQKYAAARQGLLDTLKNSGEENLGAALTNAMGDPGKIDRAYRDYERQFRSQYKAAQGATRYQGSTDPLDGLRGGLSGLGGMPGGSGSRPRTGEVTDKALDGQIKAIRRQREQAKFEALRAITEARTEVTAGKADAGIPRIRVQLAAITRLVGRAIRAYGRNAKETLTLVAQQQAAEAELVQAQVDTISSKADLAASKTNDPTAKANINIKGLQDTLAAQKANPKQYDANAIRATETQINDARQALAETVRQQAEDLLDAQYELKESLTDDPVKRAALEAQRTAAIVRRGGFTNGADKLRAQAAANNALREKQNTAVQAKVDDIDFDVEIGKMTRDQQIAAYERLIKTAKMSSQMKKSLMQQVARLKHDAENENNGAFELGLENIKIPTMYEVARLVKGGPTGVTQPVTNANQVNVYINGRADYEQLGRVLEKHIHGAGKASARAAQMR